MTRFQAERVALAAALLGILLMLYAQLSYHFGVWPR